MAELDPQLSERVQAALSQATGTEVTVRQLRPLPGGACQDNYRVDVSFASGPFQGDRRFALRSDARKGLPGSLSRAEEFAVIRAAVKAGVRTPEARWLTPGLVREGAHAYFMDWVEGEAIGRRVVRNPELANARESLPDVLAEQIAKLRTVTPDHAPEVPRARLGGVAHAIAFAREMIDRLPERHPALELSMRWLEETRPAEVPLSLVHGDFRTGNFMVTPEGLTAVLDWEFAHFGDPLEDVGWMCVRDWRFGQLALAAGGFAKRSRFFQALEKAGVAVDAVRVHWWEVMGNVRWAAGSVFQGERYLSGEEIDVELIAIARRAPEMEFEALRLIERGVPQAGGR